LNALKIGNATFADTKNAYRHDNTEEKKKRCSVHRQQRLAPIDSQAHLSASLVDNSHFPSTIRLAIICWQSSMRWMHNVKDF
jgi:hypothetical protein